MNRIEGGIKPIDLVSVRFSAQERESLWALLHDGRLKYRRLCIEYLRCGFGVRGNRKFIFEMCDQMTPDRSEYVRWGALSLLGWYAKTHPQQLWPLVAKWGSVRSCDIRSGVACCILEHIFEYHFAEFWPKAVERASHEPRFARVIATCHKFGALLKGLMWCAACDAPMNHAMTTSRNKRYRYYVCSRAQKRGWKHCETKSIPAAEVERFVVDRIRDIGSDPALLRDTLNAVTRTRESGLEALWAEQKRLKAELERLSAEERDAISHASENGVAGTLLSERLADVQERTQRLERRQTEIREEILATQGMLLDEDDLKKALSIFDPVWEHLFPKEQARIVRMLIERIDYHGGEGTLEITFRDAGIKTLCEELGEDEQDEDTQ